MKYSGMENDKEVIRNLYKRNINNTLFITVLLLIGIILVLTMPNYIEGFDSINAKMISAVLIFVYIIVMIMKVVSKLKRPFTGVVTTNDKILKKETIKIDEEHTEEKEYYLYKTHIRKSNGGYYRIERRDDSKYYDYFNVGDKVKFFPQFSEFEKLDKSSDTYIYCMFCHRKNNIKNDRCDKCNNLLFK